MKHTKDDWTVIDSGGRVMLKAVGEPQIICTLETRPLKITPEVQANAHLIAAAPKLLEACEALLKAYRLHRPQIFGTDALEEEARSAIAATKVN